MAKIPHSSASREPLSTLIAACFGDPSTSAPPPPAVPSTTDARWQDAVTQVGEQLRATLRVAVLPERHHKALALVLAHAVTLHPDGTASVQSGKQTYRLAPERPCADATHRTELCKHTLAVELHRRALALLDGTAPAPASGPTAATAAAHPEVVSSAHDDAAPAAPPPATADTRQDRLPSADRWDVHEAPASCCLRLRIGDLALMYTMRDVTDAELTSRVQHLLPWMQDLLDQARERQALLDTLRQQREAAQTASHTPTSAANQATDTPADLEARIQQAVQQALAAQHTTSHGIPPANGTAPRITPATSPADWCPLHQVAMEQRSNTNGTWWSHWLASEQRYCKGK
jgi:hypothetical protein